MNDVIALYPTARKVEDWLKRNSRGRSLLDYPIMTFPQLVDRLWREFGPRGAMLDELHEWLAAEEAIDEGREALGSADHILGLIRQFKSAALTPADLRIAARTLEGAAGASIRARINGLAGAFERYERLLTERGLGDRHDRERVVLEQLLALEQRGARPALLMGVRQLQVAEIYDFSLLQFMIVTALIRIVGDATLTIQAAEHPAGAGRFAELTWNRFVAEESIADKVLPDFVRRGGRSGRLGFVLEHLFLETVDAAPPADDTFEVVEAPTPLGEIEEVGRTIRRAMESAHPIAPERIAVVARDLAPYADHLRSVFRRYRIPLSIGQPPALRASAPARLIAEILRAPREGFRRESLAALCRSPHLTAIAPIGGRLARTLDEIGYVDGSARPLMDRFKDHLDYLRRAGEKMAAESEERREIGRSLDRIERARERFERILEALAPLAGRGTLAEHLGRLEHALEVLGFDPARTSGDPDDAGGVAADDSDDEATRTWGPVRSALDGLARWAALAGGGRVVDSAGLAAMVETAFDCAAGPVESVAAGAVAALPVLEARGLDFDLVFVIGLNDGVFPSYHPDDPLLPDEVKLALNRPLAESLRRRFGDDAPSRAGGILRTRYERNGEDFLLFFLALSMPSRRAVLSYAAAEAGGTPMVRSPFVDEVLRVLGDPHEAAAVRRIPASGVIPAMAECLSRDEFLARAAADGALESAEAETIETRAALDSISGRSAIERRREEYLALPTRAEYAEADDAGIRYSPNPKKFRLASVRDGRVAADARLARMLLGDPAAPKPLSATWLGELAACGFKFFARRVLALGRDEELDYELSAPEGGELIHDVLHRLVDQVDFRDPPGARARAQAVLAVVRDERRPFARDLGFFDLRWKSIERTAREFIEIEIGGRAANPDTEILTEHEIHFALDDPGAPGYVRLWLQGRIDRLELHPGRGTIRTLRVIDYKNSRNADRYAGIAKPEGAQFGWTDFQLPVYLMGALGEFGDRLAANATLEAGYLVLRSREKEQIAPVARALVDPDPMRRAAASKSSPPPVAERIIALVGEALEGRFDVDPRRCDDWCPYRTVCRYYKPAEPGA